MIVDRKWAAVVIGIVLVVGVAIGLALRTGLPVVKQQGDDKAKRAALAFYSAYTLNQDSAAAWEMMHPAYQKRFGSKEAYLSIRSLIATVPTPARLDIQERQLPDLGEVVYLIRSSAKEPLLIGVTSGDPPLIIDARFWEGESSP